MGPTRSQGSSSLMFCKCRVFNKPEQLDNDPDDLMRLISETIAQAKPSTPWKERIVLGCWAVSNYLDFWF
jgi:hypothetical protein